MRAKVTEVRFRNGSGYGLYAARDLAAGEVVVAYEEREHVLVTRGHVARNWPAEGLRAGWFRAYAYPLSEEVWVSWSEEPERWLPVNHCCDPNTWLRGLDLVARRDVGRGQQVTCDYATFCVDNMQDFKCT